MDTQFHRTPEWKAPYTTWWASPSLAASCTPQVARCTPHAAHRTPHIAHRTLHAARHKLNASCFKHDAHGCLFGPTWILSHQSSEVVNGNKAMTQWRQNNYQLWQATHCKMPSADWKLIISKRTKGKKSLALTAQGLKARGKQRSRVRVSWVVTC